MDWRTFLTALLTSLGGTAALIALAAFVAKKWLGVRIEESVRHEYASRLEEHKAQLQEQLNRAVHEMELEVRETAEREAADTVLFQEFLEALPPEGNIRHIRELPLVTGYRQEHVGQLETFAHMWSNPDHEFLDPGLEEKRRLLHERVSELLAYLGINTSADGDRDWFAVPYQWGRERRVQIGERVDELTDDVLQAYDDLARTGRAKLRYRGRPERHEDSPRGQNAQTQ